MREAAGAARTQPAAVKVAASVGDIEPRFAGRSEPTNKLGFREPSRSLAAARTLAPKAKPVTLPSFETQAVAQQSARVSKLVDLPSSAKAFASFDERASQAIE